MTVQPTLKITQINCSLLLREASLYAWRKYVSDNLITLAKQQLSLAGPPSNQSPMETDTSGISAQSSSQVNPHPHHKPDNYEKTSSSQQDRKFNVVIFGIAEPSSGSSPFA